MQVINAFIIGVIASLSSWTESKREEGQTLVEYALIIALIAIVLVASLNFLAGGIGGVYSGIVTQFGS